MNTNLNDKTAMKKEYFANITLRLPRARSKRLRENGVGAAGAAVIVSSGGSTSEPVAGTSGGHTHANKADLDQLTTDTLGYVHVTRLAEVADPDSGEVTVEEVTEKVKAGLADLATDLTEDSPANKRFLSRLADDVAEGFLTLKKGLRAVAKALFDAGAEFGQFVSGSSGARVDAQGNAEVETLTARKSVEAKQLTADSVQVNKSMNFGAPMVAGVSGGGVWVDDVGNVHLQVDFAEVTKKATFAEAEVKKLRHVGGVIILSPASMECSAVEVTAEGYKCYFLTESPDYPQKKVSNEFAVGDLARCQTCNLREGTTLDAANRYYWRKVIGVGEDYIVLSETDCDPAAVNDAPAPGDSIIQIGNESDPSRQNPIIIAAYGGGSPYIYQFMGIDDYSLPDAKAVTKISPSGNRFTGDFHVTTGSDGNTQSIGDYVVDHSRVYRLVGRANLSTDNPTVTCNAYVIRDGVMTQLTLGVNGGGLIASGGELLCLGNSLLFMGDDSSGVVQPELLSLTYTVYTVNPTTQEPMADPDLSVISYDGRSPIGLLPDCERIDFTLWRNGSAVAEASIEGPRQVTARFSVLADRIQSEVTERKNADTELKSTVTQTANRITSEVTERKNADTELRSYIDQTADSISLKIGEAEVSAKGNYAHNTTPLSVARQYEATRIIDNLKSYHCIELSDIYADGLTSDNTVTLRFQYSIRSGIAALSSLAPGVEIAVYLVCGTQRIKAAHGIKDVNQTGITTNSGQCINGSFTSTFDLSGFDSLTATDRISVEIWSTFSPNPPIMIRAWISDLRINLGSKALPWSPHPADSTEAQLRDTGIDIYKKQITLTADNVRILNNAGQETASFDADGEFCAHRVIARNSDGTIVAAMNASGRGEYTMYYPDGKRKMELMPSEDRDQALIFYDRDGETPLWTLGASGFAWQVEQHFVTVNGYILGMTDAEAHSLGSFSGSSPLFRFEASEGSPNADYNGLYYVKDTVTDLTEERANGRYYAAVPTSTPSGTIRSYMDFDNGVMTGPYHINCN